MLGRLEDLRRLTCNSLAPSPLPQHERSLVNRLGRAIHQATSVWVIVIYSVFYLLTSREVLSSLQGVISYDMWVRHTPPLYSSILSFFFFLVPKTFIFQDWQHPVFYYHMFQQRASLFTPPGHLSRLHVWCVTVFPI